MTTEISKEILDQYKARIKRHLDEGMYSFFRAGRELLEVKQLFPPVKPGPSDQPNEFKLWIESSFPIGYVQCCKLIRLVTYHEERPDNCLSIDSETLLLLFPKDEAQHIRDTAHAEGWSQKQTQAAIAKEKKLLEQQHLQALKNQRTSYEEQIKTLEDAAQTPVSPDEYAKFQIEIAEKTKIIKELTKAIADKDKSIVEKEKKAWERGKDAVLTDAKTNIAKAKDEAATLAARVKQLEAELSKTTTTTPQVDVKKLKADLIRTQNELSSIQRTQANPVELIDVAIKFHSEEVARHQAALVKLQAQREALV
jgi:hypothetical protein